MRLRAAFVTLAFVTTALAAAPSALAQADPAEDPPNGTIGVGLALGSTLASTTILYVAAQHEHAKPVAYASLALLAVAPSAGHIYAGEADHAIVTSLLRTSSLLLALVGLDQASKHPLDSSKNGLGLIGLGILSYLVAAGYDIYDAQRAVEESGEDAPTTGFAPRRPVTILSFGGSF